jgi:hypothetical protein
VNSRDILNLAVNNGKACRRTTTRKDHVDEERVSEADHCDVGAPLFSANLRGGMSISNGGHRQRQSSHRRSEGADRRLRTLSLIASWSGNNDRLGVPLLTARAYGCGAKGKNMTYSSAGADYTSVDVALNVLALEHLHHLQNLQEVVHLASSPSLFALPG